MKSAKPPKTNESRNWRDDPDLLADIVFKAMKRAVKQAIARHHQAGNEVAIWRRGKIVLLAPDGTTRPVEEEPKSAK